MNIVDTNTIVKAEPSGKKYKSIFFDLDHTLWDYETNSRETLDELFQAYELAKKGVTSVAAFQQQFKKINTELWYLYDRGMIDSEVIRRERFKQILEPFQAYNEKLSSDLSRDYLDLCPRKGNLMPHAHDILSYLGDHYRMTVITNGFEEIQHLKLTAGNLHGYFDHIITSQKAGHRKPSREIFECALQFSACQCHEAVMIGDNLVTDIGGARNAAITAVFYNSEEVTHTETLDYEITSLNDLRAIL